MIVVQHRNSWSDCTSYSKGRIESVRLNKQELIPYRTESIISNKYNHCLLEFIEAIKSYKNLINPTIRLNIRVNYGDSNPELIIEGFKKPTEQEFELFNKLAAEYSEQEKTSRKITKEKRDLADRETYERLKRKFDKNGV